MSATCYEVMIAAQHIRDRAELRWQRAVHQFRAGQRSFESVRPTLVAYDVACRAAAAAMDAYLASPGADAVEEIEGSDA